MEVYRRKNSLDGGVRILWQGGNTALIVPGVFLTKFSADSPPVIGKSLKFAQFGIQRIETNRFTLLNRKPNLMRMGKISVDRLKAPEIVQELQERHPRMDWPSGLPGRKPFGH